jgi:hypothetical protein
MDSPELNETLRIEPTASTAQGVIPRYKHCAARAGGSQEQERCDREVEHGLHID